jgi:cell shape-determining protein MreC
VANLRVQLDDLKRIAEDHARYGDIRALCTPYAVIGTDTGARSTLAIQGSSLEGLRDGMVALYPDGIVGRVQRAGVAGARVQLVTDLGFRVRVGFARFEGAKFFRVGKTQTLAEGSGRGAMLIKGLTRENVKEVTIGVGDWVILNEPEYPPYLQGRVLGRVTAIAPRPDAPLWDQIVVEPPQNLMRLTEVMIVTKESVKEKG